MSFVGQNKENFFTQPTASSSMKLESSAFAHNKFIPAKYTCDGENINPSLVISGIPKEAKSLVFIVDDPDAPMGTWIHWTMWGISPNTNIIKEGELPKDTKEGLNSFGAIGYGGPCPPEGTGTHRYSFRIYALDKNVDLVAGITPEELENEMSNSIIDTAELVGLYTHDK